MLQSVFQILADLDVKSFCYKSKDIWILIGNIVRILQIAVPIIIILLGTIDLGKAVMAGKDDEIKAAQKMFLKRLIYGIAVFFVVMVVRAVFGVIGTRDTTNADCFEYVANGNG